MQQMTLAEIVQDIHAMDEELWHYESRYGYSYGLTSSKRHERRVTESRLPPMRNTFLPFSPPLLGEDEIAEVIDTLRSDWITILRHAQDVAGPKVRRFEQDPSAPLRLRSGCSSGQDSLRSSARRPAKGRR